MCGKRRDSELCWLGVFVDIQADNSRWSSMITGGRRLAELCSMRGTTTLVTRASVPNYCRYPRALDPVGHVGHKFERRWAARRGTGSTAVHECAKAAGREDDDPAGDGADLPRLPCGAAEAAAVPPARILSYSRTHSHSCSRAGERQNSAWVWSYAQNSVGATRGFSCTVQPTLGSWM
ncbi:hypothetical protein B0H11DRAFT_1963347, partial [Mycena galericulata]